MFVSDDSLMGIVGVTIVLMIIQGNTRNTLRRRKVEGSIHQYNISPSQTMWSTRFYTPKLRRLVLIIALAITIDSRAMNTPPKTDLHPTGATHVIHPQKSQRHEPIVLLAYEETHQIQRWNILPLDMYTKLDNPNWARETYHSHKDPTPKNSTGTAITGALTTLPPGPVSQTLL